MNFLIKSFLNCLIFISLVDASFGSTLRFEFVYHHSTTVARFFPEQDLMEIDSMKFSLVQSDYQNFLLSIKAMIDGSQNACEESPISFVRFFENDSEKMICDLKTAKKMRRLLNQLQMVSKKRP